MTAPSSITVQVPLTIRRRGGRKLVVTPEGSAASPAPAHTRADPALLKALARGFRYRKLLDQRRYGSISEMAVAERIDRGYLGRLLQLTLLAPGIVETILEGRQPEGVALPLLTRPFATAWRDQLAMASFRSERHPELVDCVSCRCDSLRTS